MTVGAESPTGADPTGPRVVPREPAGRTAEERRAWGRELRDEVPREAHGEWQPGDDRPDPVALLEEQGASRIASLVPVRYGRMLVSPFTFYRGAALVMAADLARMPCSGIFTQCCGDAHLSNFGIFATPERRLVFDLDDFDETYQAPFEWDVKRLAASVVIAGRDNGFDDTSSSAAAVAGTRRYREVIVELAALPYLDVWYSRMDVEQWLAELKSKSGVRKVARKLYAKASTRTNLGSLNRFAEQVDGGWRIREEPPIVIRVDPGETTPTGVTVGEVMQNAWGRYLASLRPDLRILLSHYTYVDFAQKVVGVGSVGTGAFMLLGMGPHGDDPLFLQMKEAPPSVLERYTVSGVFSNDGERVVTGQRLMQAASDQFLGWMRVEELARPYDFYVRQLRDWKMSLEVAAMTPEQLEGYAAACGEALARAHARGGSSSAIAGYLGRGDKFERAILRFALAYADQNERDYDALAEADRSGRITALHGV